MKYHSSLLTYGSTHTRIDLTTVVVSRAQGHTGAVSVLADGLDLLLRETDYHHPPIYPHKHPAAPKENQGTVSIKQMHLSCSIRDPQAKANSVTGITGSKSQ